MKYVCPCCGYRTLDSRYQTDTCFLCWWEDDILGEQNPDEIIGGPNGDYSLTEAKINFRKNLIMFRKSDRRYTKLRNTKMDEIKTELMSLFQAYEKEDDELGKYELTNQIQTNKNNLKTELKCHKKRTQTR